MNETIEIRNLPENETERELRDEELDLAVGGQSGTAPNSSKDSSASGETDDF